MTLLGLALALTATPATAGKRDRTVTLPCTWEPGTTWNYRSERTSFDPVTSTTTTVTTPVTLSVQTSQPTVTTFRYLVGPSTIEPEGPDHATVSQFGSLMVGIPIDVVTTSGEPLGVANHAELVEHLSRALDTLLDAGIDPALVEQIHQVYADPDQGPSSLLQDISPLLGGLCQTVSLRNAVEEEVGFPNPLGGPLLPGTRRQEGESIDRKAQTLTFARHQYLDSEATREVVIAQLVKLLKGQGADPEAAQELAQREVPRITEELRSRYTMSTRHGLPVQVSATRTVGTDDETREQSWSWTRDDDLAPIAIRPLPTTPSRFAPPCTFEDGTEHTYAFTTRRPTDDPAHSPLHAVGQTHVRIEATAESRPEQFTFTTGPLRFESDQASVPDAVARTASLYPGVAVQMRLSGGRMQLDVPDPDLDPIQVSTGMAPLLVPLCAPSLKPDGSYTWDEPFPNPSGGAPIPGQSELTLSAVDLDARTLQYSLVSQTHDVDVPAIEGETPLPSTRVDASYLLSMDSGMPLEVDYQKRVTGEDGEQLWHDQWTRQ